MGLSGEVSVLFNESYCRSLYRDKCDWFLKKSTYAGCGVRTHAHLCAEDLKSSPLTSRANQLMFDIFNFIYIFLSYFN